MTPTSPENLLRINAVVAGLVNVASNLWCRWQDEKEYEDINDYKVPFQNALPEGFVITKMTKRPFGFHFTIGTDAVYSFYMTSRSGGWKRVK